MPKTKTNPIYSESGRKQLDDLYNRQGLPIREIAKVLGTYPVLIFRALKHHGYEIRDKSSAQTLALETGRSTHPTEGTERSQSTKIKIGDSLYSFWKKNGHLLKDKWRQKGLETWNSLSEEKKIEIKQKAAVALKKSSEEGSKLEKFLFNFLSANNVRCVLHKKHLVCAEELEMDLFLPEDAICIEVDGPLHYYPLFGEKDLQKHINSDNRKNGLLLHDGYVIIRVRNLLNYVSETAMREFGKTLLKKITQIKLDFPEKLEERIIYLDIGEFINE